MTLAAGCADSRPRRDAVGDTAVLLLTAARDGDGAAACAVLAPDTVSALEQSANASCADAIVEEDLPEPGTVRHVRVYGQRAQVVLDDDTVFLAAFPGGWRVVAAGCQPQGERPYDCVLQEG
ncbi:hypothetical protein OHA72_27100 [Dactylosporangium sp. NBC_01737]|uniref:hypothetical protein n=1 Tax=Dactylosporangium sp. NBC_01737 TaxID=2975959 RepID=UPI002E1396FB|nr:hypothetical protein OHA72_27100 [Dactylosporangium sp. NBC_01737]